MPRKKTSRKKTTGKSGKPLLTVAERAASVGLSVADYNKRAKINVERKKLSNKYVSDNMKGVSDPAKRKKIFGESWKHANSVVRKKYGDEIKRLKIVLKS